MNTDGPGSETDISQIQQVAILWCVHVLCVRECVKLCVSVGLI